MKVSVWPLTSSVDVYFFSSRLIQIRVFRMLDFFTIFSKGGIVLWCFQGAGVTESFTGPVNALIRSVILQVGEIKRRVPLTAAGGVYCYCEANANANEQSTLAYCVMPVYLPKWH